jgi:hypothetical protein
VVLYAAVSSVIGGGGGNTICGGSAGIVSGVKNVISSGTLYDFIGGGECNTVSNSYGSVVGGCNNLVSGLYSSILGGSGNIAGAALNYAGIFGCNVHAVASCTFHANNFVAQNMPNSASLPGQFYCVFYAPLGGYVVMIG